MVIALFIVRKGLSNLSLAPVVSLPCLLTNRVFPTIVWVFTGVALFSAGILYLIKNGDIKTLTELPKGLGYLIDFFKNYWSYCFIAIWIFDFIINFRDINKDTVADLSAPKEKIE